MTHKGGEKTDPKNTTGPSFKEDGGAELAFVF